MTRFTSTGMARCTPNPPEWPDLPPLNRDGQIYLHYTGMARCTSTGDPTIFFHSS